MKDLFKIHEKVYEVAREWAYICNEEIDDVYMSVGSLSGYIKMKSTMYYLRDLNKLDKMLNRIKVEITTVEQGDEELEVWFFYDKDK